MNYRPKIFSNIQKYSVCHFLYWLTFFNFLSVNIFLLFSPLRDVLYKYLYIKYNIEDLFKFRSLQKKSSGAEFHPIHDCKI